MNPAPFFSEWQRNVSGIKNVVVSVGKEIFRDKQGSPPAILSVQKPFDSSTLYWNTKNGPFIKERTISPSKKKEKNPRLCFYFFLQFQLRQLRLRSATYFSRSFFSLFTKNERQRKTRNILQDHFGSVKKSLTI